jgi:hypothetical protein
LTWALNAAGAEAPLEVFEETVERGRSLGFESETVALGALARRRALRGDVPEAKELLAEVLDRVVRLDVRLGIGLYVDLLADLAAREKKHRLAARRSGGAEAVFAAAAAPITPLVGDRAARLALLRERLGDASFEAETAAGRNGGPSKPSQRHWRGHGRSCEAAPRPSQSHLT